VGSTPTFAKTLTRPSSLRSPGDLSLAGAV
jgi:hypothetical protein